MGENAEQEAIDRLARAALAPYGLGADAVVRLVNVSENYTYRVDDPATGAAYALRLHRPGYHSAAAIESELMWIDALRDEGVVDSVVAVAAEDGRRVTQAGLPDVEQRNVVLFDWAEGAPPDPEAADPLPGYRMLGRIAARMHGHARRWQRPAAFTRFSWAFDDTLGAHGHWGRWQDGVGVDGETLALFQRTVDTIERRLADYGTGPERFGLCHCDQRLANLLEHGDEIRVIDFDDCGFGWFMYDYATTVSFFEEHPREPEFRAAWLEGYREVAPIDPADEAELDTFVMLRRLMLVTWIGSHYAFATEAQELGEGFTVDTVPLAEAYLSTYE
jgi:Ser/Thr protein kinase RdoA (MazF antagonist)